MSITPNRFCNLCHVDIFEEDGYLCCECYLVYIYELETGMLDYPDFWVEKNDEE